MEHNDISVSGVVIFFHPTEKHINNIKTYLYNVDRLYIVDNTPEPLCDDVIKTLDKKITYIALKHNYGLGYATNKGAHLAFQDGYTWMLLLDQDTRFEANAIGILKQYAVEKGDKYSLFCPNIIAVGDYDEEFYTVIPDRKTDMEINWATASGSLINLAHFWDVGGVWAELFIEHLDVELGIKFHLKGYKNFRVGSSLMRQRFGNSQPRKLLWKTVHPGFTKPIRYYYIFRNQQLLKNKYGSDIVNFTGVHLYTAVVKIILFENYRWQKLIMAIRGTLDGKKGMTGEAKIQ